MDGAGQQDKKKTCLAEGDQARQNGSALLSVNFGSLAIVALPPQDSRPMALRPRLSTGLLVSVAYKSKSIIVVLIFSSHFCKQCKK